MNASNTQTRGNCPLCGREQAVKSGTMSKHGYTVAHGWFQGVCRGQDHGPMQLDRSVTDAAVAQIRADVAKLEARAAALQSGAETLGMVTIHSTMPSVKPQDVEWASLPSYQQENILKTQIWNINSRAKSGTEFADFLEATVNRVHGQALIQAEKPAATVYIEKGEKRNCNGRIYTARFQDGARVYFNYTANGNVFKSWMGSKAWRALDKAE